MSSYDFTYSIPENFNERIIQFLQQRGKNNVADAFVKCKYEYDDVGLAYYAGLRGDNWDKKALDFVFEGTEDTIKVLKNNKDLLIEIMEKSLKSNTSGYLIRNVDYLVTSSTMSVLPVSDKERINADINSANKVLKDVIWIGERVCTNAAYNGENSEDTINDYFRDMLLSKGYSETKDQTRHGKSLSEKNAGEVDILLTENGKEIALIEGLRLKSVNKDYIDTHIDKAVNNYNSLGTATFILAYVSVSDFQSFWGKFIDYIKNCNYSVEIKTSIKELTSPNASTKIANAIFSRNGYDFPIYFLAFEIR